MKIDKQIMDIQMSSSTKDTLEVLKLSTAQQSVIDDDLDDAEELMEAISDQNYNLQKITDMFTPDKLEEDLDEDLLNELKDDIKQQESQEKEPQLVEKDEYEEPVEDEKEYEDYEKEQEKEEEEKDIFA
mmetsp:Transcript_25362/g.22483  ORF Transcript_25362/g.22483 Transcript_25362/m.22483 type:complete len:129 (+) Transcript_25362:849-1235(+)